MSALGELGVVARGQSCMQVGDFNVPTKIPCLAKGISAGLRVDVEAAWALACGVRPAALASALGILLVVIEGTSWSAALLPLLFFLAGFSLTGGLLLILLSGRGLTVSGGLVGLLSRCSVLLCGLLLGCLLWTTVGVLSRRRC